MPVAGYSVLVERGILDRIAPVIRKLVPAHRYAVITDSHVGPLYADRVRAGFDADTIDVFETPAGEAQKTRENWARLTDRMLDAGYGRDSAVIALGGGVVGDLAGFVAATFMRGVPVVQIPTSLLAMIDASIGGKTGVDTPAGKNLVGTFYPPAGVIVEPQLLATLPLRELRAGIAEAIKHGVIADETYFLEVVRNAPKLLSADGSTSDRMFALIVRSIEIKADVVSRDEREGGLRKILNFGHTIGHALELVTGYSLLHGEAVSIGMTIESRLAELVGIARPGTAVAIRDALSDAGLPTDLPPGCDRRAVVEAMRSDKKVRSGKTMFSLPSRIGSMAGAGAGWTVSVGDDQLREVLA